MCQVGEPYLKKGIYNHVKLSEALFIKIQPSSSSFVTDTTPAILILVLLVAWPKENIFKGFKYECLITWKVINEHFPWNILLLCGGGLALAAGFEVILIKALDEPNI